MSRNTPDHPLLAQARGLIPALRARAPEIEQGRHLPDDLAAQLAAMGIYRMLRPADIGGLECEPAVALHVLEILAEGDASAGWCAMIGATSGLYSAYLDPELARKVYGAGAEVITAGVFAPMGQAIPDGDDYIVSGHWRWASGSRNAQWLNGGCLVMENGQPRKLPNGQPEVRAMIFPATQVELVDTWHTLGLRGSGSVDMKVQGIRVPQARSVSLMADTPRAKGPLYAFPVFGLLAMGIASVASGNARAALDEFRDFAGGARTGGARKVLAERAPVQQKIGELEGQWRAARAFLYDEVAQAWDAACSGRELDVTTRARLRLASTHVTRAAATVCREVQDLSGGAGVFDDSALQRRLRDAQTATAHMMIAPPTYELAGRVLLGLPTDATTV